MKKCLFLSVLIFTSFGLLAQTNDPLVMTVNGKGVKKSEFEYIYNKNNNETSLEKLSVDEYVELFKNFKLKVTEAETQGLDTTASFRREFKEYRDLLARPYLVFDEEIDYTLMQKEYNSQTELYEIYQLIIPFEPTWDNPNYLFPSDTLEAYNKIVEAEKKFKKGAKFENLIKEYTTNEKVLQAEKPGYIGWISPMQYITELSMGLIDVPAGKISKPIRSSYGYHLMYVVAKKPNKGEIRASHILLMPPQGADELMKADLKMQIDSIYNELKNGADFAELAQKHSADGTGARGGDLGFFGLGRMVPEFEDAAFALENIGDISEPIESQFGYHIIKLTGKRDILFDDMKDNLRNKMEKTGLKTVIFKPTIDRLKKENNFSLNKNNFDRLYQEAITVYPSDSLYISKFQNDNAELFSINGTSYSIADFIQFMTKSPRSYYRLSTENISDCIKEFEYASLIKEEDKALEAKHPEFKNLVQEYRDGILLFEVSNQEVWERSSTDIEGLTAFFEKNKNKYTWDEPHYKGYVVLVKDKKTQNKIQKEIKGMDTEQAAQYILDNYKVGDVSYVRLEKGVFVKGNNQYIDEMAFNTGKATLPENYETFFLVGKMLDHPEVYTDVRGLIITDYQDYLEKNWIQELNRKYPVVIYQEVLSTIN